jgi:hypothetical protein
MGANTIIRTALSQAVGGGPFGFVFGHVTHRMLREELT